MFLKKLPVLIQLIFMLILIMVIPITITVYYSTVNLVKYSEEEIAESVLAQLKSNSTLNERELFNIVQSTTMIIGNSDLKGMKGITSYEILNSHYDYISKALKLQSYLKNLEENNDLIESVVFVPEDGDYIVSSKESIIKKKDYENLLWLEQAKAKKQGLSGYWYPRMKNDIPIISYLYQLNRLTTSVKGIIVVNIYEDKINELLSYGKYKIDSDAMMILEDGTILSHKDKELLFQNQKLPNYILPIFKSTTSTGYYYIEDEGDRLLCAYYRPGNRNWTYSVTYSMKGMLVGVDKILTNQIILMLFIMISGVIATVIYANGFSKPMKKLAEALKAKNGLREEKIKGNEITFLTQAFETLENEEKQLYLMLKEKEKDTKNRIVHNLLSGELGNNKEEIHKLFPYKLYMVALIIIDNHREYLEQLDSKSRTYQRYKLIDEIKNSFPKHYYIQAARYEGGNIAVIMNMEGYDYIKSRKEIHDGFKQVQKAAEVIFKHTISIGISNVHMEEESVYLCTYEAIEASRKRLFKGRNSILFWENFNQQSNKEQGYYYPYESIEKIMNYLAIKDIVGIKTELDYLQKELMQRINSISYDNVRMIFNQLAGATVKFMMRYQLDFVKILGVKQDIYSKLSSSETIEEAKMILSLWYENIISYSMREQQECEEACYSKRILKYLNEHYTEDLLYEEVAEKIGISYSYLRKIVKDTTGKSLNDYINKIRIEKVKVLLITTEMTIEQIAKEVGYHNVQSITRYFKKFEGITPTEFRITNQVS